MAAKTLDSDQLALSRAGVILTCHAWYRDQVGGSFKIATELAEYLARCGRRVYYVCGTDDRRPANPSFENGVEIWRYPYPRAKSPHPCNLMGHVWETHRLTRLILRREPNAWINGHTPLQFLGAALALRAGLNSRGQLVYSVHSPFSGELDSGLYVRGKNWRRAVAVMLAKAIDWINCWLANSVQCYSKFSASLLVREFGKSLSNKTIVTPGWVDVARFGTVKDSKTARTRLGGAWETDEPVFFTVRRLESRMGLDSLVEAASILGREHSFRLLIGGGGPLEGAIKEQIHEAGLEDRVRVLGRIAESDLPYCYTAADCFVLPTRALECFGLIVLEAFASGTPVIGTPVGAIPELVSQQGDGWLTSGTDAKEIADRMAAFLRGELTVDRQKLRAIAEQYRAEVGLGRLADLLLREVAV